MNLVPRASNIHIIDVFFFIYIQEAIVPYNNSLVEFYSPCFELNACLIKSIHTMLISMRGLLYSYYRIACELTLSITLFSILLYYLIPQGFVTHPYTCKQRHTFSLYTPALSNLKVSSQIVTFSTS